MIDRDYFKSYYAENKSRWREYQSTEKYREYQKNYHKDRKVNKTGNYIYFIQEDFETDYDEVVYIGSCNIIEDRMAVHKKIGKIKKANDEGVPIKIFYLELDKDLSKGDRELIEHYFINDMKPKWNEKVKKIDKRKAKQLLEKVEFNFKDYKFSVGN